VSAEYVAAVRRHAADSGACNFEISRGAPAWVTRPSNSSGDFSARRRGRGMAPWATCEKATGLPFTAAVRAARARAAVLSRFAAAKQRALSSLLRLRSPNWA